MQLAIWLLTIIAVLSLVGTFIPQNEESAFYIDKFGHAGYDVLSKTGLTTIYSSWWFILFLILLFLNLSVCLLNRFSLKIRALGSMMSHFSILVILIGALTGMFFGQKGLIKINEGEEVNSFVSKQAPVHLGFSVKLTDFIYSEHIDPRERLLVYSRQAENVCMIGNNISEADKNKGLIAQIPTEAGVESQIPGIAYKVKVLRYVPDFVIDTSTKEVASRSATANNPAIEVELKDKDGKVLKTFWVFARFPEMHQQTDEDLKFVYDWVGRRPKDFVSKVAILKEGKEVMTKDIRVNEPLRFGGYAFFQYTYDQEGLAWTGLQVVKDPGVPVVYGGFILLILGLMMIFYVNPLIQRN